MSIVYLLQDDYASRIPVGALTKNSLPMPLRIQSLSPEQQRFAQAFRKMQLFLGLVLDGTI